jgi:hypothetical protein
VHGSTAELLTPELADDQRAHFAVHVPLRQHAPYTARAGAFLTAASSLLGIESSKLTGHGRDPRRARLRTTVVLAWRILGRRNNEICAALQVSQAAVSNIITRASQDDLRQANRLVARLL